MEGKPDTPISISFSMEMRRRINEQAKLFIAKSVGGRFGSDVAKVSEINDVDEIVSSYKNDTNNGISKIDDNTHAEIRDLAKAIKKDYGSIISLSFIEESIVDWIFEFSKDDQELSAYLQEKMNQSIKCYRFAFPIHIARWNGTKKLLFHVTSDVDFETQSHPSFEKYLYPQFDGIIDRNTIFACTTVWGEFEHSKEIAFDKCSFAVDIFKMCSDFSRDPHQKKCRFEIREENINKDISVFVSWDTNLPTDDERSFNVSLKAYPTEIDADYIRRAINNNLKDFSSLYEDCYSDNPNTICMLLKKAIRRYGVAISEHNIFDRIESLCSVLDMLILDKNKSIVASLKKYIPILIEEQTECREDLATFIGKMYAIRSKSIHHDEQSDTCWQEVYYLNFIVFHLLHRFSKLRNQYNDIQDIFKDIDKVMSSVIFNPSKNHLSNE